MKRILALAFVALAAVGLSYAPPAHAGVTQQEVAARNGIIVYARLPDGTYTPVTLNTAGGLTQGGSAGITQLGYQQLTSLSSSSSLTVPTGSLFIMAVPETQAVRWRPDGSTTAPTASVGMPLAVSQPLVYAGDLAAIRFIEQSASAKLNVFYFK